MTDGFNYIQHCYELFPNLTKIKFGRNYQLEAIEKRLAHVKLKNCLNQEDVILIRDAKEWDYKRYWPDQVYSIELEKPIRGIFNLGWEGRKRTISELFDKFLNIEVVSVILRFVDPNIFAIISPPVEKFFSLQPQENHIEYYLTYLADLHKTQKKFQKPENIAHIDMAIWTLFYIINNWGDHGFQQNWGKAEQSDIELIISLYKRDRFFKKMRLVEALKHAYINIGQEGCDPNRLFLADCLDSEDIDPDLAMIAVSYSLEKFLWSLIEETGRMAEFRELRPRQKWIEKLNGTKITRTANVINRCLWFRDRSVHPWLKKLDPREREEFIASLESLIIKKKANSL